MIKIIVDDPRELLWLHSVISTGTLNMSENEIEYFKQKLIPTTQEITYKKSDAYPENDKKYLKELENNGK